MRKNKDGDWIATGPMDLIGWEIRIVEFLPPREPDREGTFIIMATNSTIRGARLVKASMEAIPITSLERWKGKE